MDNVNAFGFEFWVVSKVALRGSAIDFRVQNVKLLYFGVKIAHRALQTILEALYVVIAGVQTS